jgi:hypothetical protein
MFYFYSSTWRDLIGEMRLRVLQEQLGIFDTKFDGNKREPTLCIVDGLRTPMYEQMPPNFDEISMAKHVATKLLESPVFHVSNIDSIIWETSKIPSICNELRFSCAIPLSAATNTIISDSGLGIDSFKLGCEYLSSGKAKCVLLGASNVEISKKPFKTDEIQETLGEMYSITKKEEELYCIGSYANSIQAKSKGSEFIVPMDGINETPMNLEDQTLGKDSRYVSSFRSCASCLILMTEENCQKLSIKPLCTVSRASYFDFGRPEMSILASLYTMQKSMFNPNLMIPDFYEIHEESAIHILSILKASTRKLYRSKTLLRDSFFEILPQNINLTGGSISNGCGRSSQLLVSILNSLESFQKGNFGTGVVSVSNHTECCSIFLTKRQ